MNQAAVMRSARRIGAPQVVSGLATRKPRRNLVEYLDAFVGLVKRDNEKIQPLKLGYDSLIAATALANNMEVVTENVADFPGLKVINPLKA